MNSHPNLKYIDALRGWSILGVILCHAYYLFDNQLTPSLVGNVFKNASSGVELFFFVSAFTLFLSLDSLKGKEKNPWRNYFIRRFLRITPMFYLAVGFSLVYFGFGPMEYYNTTLVINHWNILTHLSFTFGFFPQFTNSLVHGGWTVATEVYFYFLLPFLFLRIKDVTKALQFFYLALLVRLVFKLVFQPFETDRVLHAYSFEFILNQLPVFALGILSYFMVYKNERPSLPSLIPFLFFFFTDLMLQRDIFFGEHIRFGFLFVLLVAVLHSYPLPLVVNRFFELLGKVSYSVYFIHVFILFWIKDHLIFKDFPSGTPLLDTLRLTCASAVILFCSFSLAYFTFKWIEEPARNLGKQWIDNLEKRMA
jgi:peptidoglycan/LPS O-acetylase OafA/YrhL